MSAGKPALEDQITKEYSLFGGSDRLEPLRVIMRGSLSGKHLPTPEWESGFSRKKDNNTSQEPVETKDTCAARQIWEEDSTTVNAPDPWVAVASAYGFSISQADDKKTSWPIKRAPVSPRIVRRACQKPSHAK